MVKKYYVITWRPSGERVFFFRGDNRYPIYLPYIGDDEISTGWVYSIKYARLIEGFPIYESNSISKSLDVTRLKIFEYRDDVLPTQVIRPLVRPRF